MTPVFSSFLSTLPSTRIESTLKLLRRCTGIFQITFEAGGKQYVAILAGLGGAWPKWFVGSTPGLEKVQPGQTLYVFGL